MKSYLETLFYRHYNSPAEKEKAFTELCQAGLNEEEARHYSERLCEGNYYYTLSPAEHIERYLEDLWNQEIEPEESLPQFKDCGLLTSEQLMRMWKHLYLAKPYLQEECWSWIRERILESPTMAYTFQVSRLIRNWSE